MYFSRKMLVAGSAVLIWKENSASVYGDLCGQLNIYSNVSLLVKLNMTTLPEHLAMVSVGNSLSYSLIKRQLSLIFSFFHLHVWKYSSHYREATYNWDSLEPGTWDSTTTHTPGHKSPQTNYRETIAD